MGRNGWLEGFKPSSPGLHLIHLVPGEQLPDQGVVGVEGDRHHIRHDGPQVRAGRAPHGTTLRRRVTQACPSQSTVEEAACRTGPAAVSQAP